MKKHRARKIGRALLGASLLLAAASPARLLAGACPPDGCVGDANGDGEVKINELIIAVNNSLEGCPEPQGPLGTREFTIAPVSAAQRTALYTTALPVSVASEVTAGPIKILGGTPDANGIASLSIAEDAQFAVRIIDGSVVCFRIRAEGSSGTIDCDGGSPYDVTLTAEPGPDAPPGMLLTGQGSDGGPGAATLLVMQQSAQLPAGTPLSQCDTAEYDALGQAAYTTAMTTVTKGAVGPLSLEGENFDCAAFTTTDGPGMIVSPSAANDARAGGDLVNNLRLADHN